GHTKRRAAGPTPIPPPAPKRGTRQSGKKQGSKKNAAADARRHDVVFSRVGDRLAGRTPSGGARRLIIARCRIASYNRLLLRLASGVLGRRECFKAHRFLADLAGRQCASQKTARLGNGREIRLLIQTPAGRVPPAQKQIIPAVGFATIDAAL